MRRMSLVGSLVAAVALTSLSTTLAAEQISVAGSSTVKPIVDEAVKAFGTSRPDVKFVVGAGGSSQGVKLAGKGEVQIGMASRDLKDKEKAEFPALVSTKIGLDGVAVVVHTKNPVKEITSQQLLDAFTGKITNWKELGGEDAPITLISTNSKHGTYDAFIEHFKLEGVVDGDSLRFKPKGSEETPAVAARAVDGNKAVLAAVMTQPHALSYASLGTAAAMSAKGAPLKLLRLDGVTADEANVFSGSYKFQRSLLVLTNGESQGTVRAFIDFLLSEPGKEIIQRLDYLPIR